MQKQQLELPVKECGIGIGGIKEYIPAMVLSNHLKIIDKIPLFIQDEAILRDGITFLEISVQQAFDDYKQLLEQYGTCTCLPGNRRECLLKHMNFDDFKHYS